MHDERASYFLAPRFVRKVSRSPFKDNRFEFRVCAGLDRSIDRSLNRALSACLTCPRGPRPCNFDLRPRVARVCRGQLFQLRRAWNSKCNRPQSRLRIRRNSMILPIDRILRQGFCFILFRCFFHYWLRIYSQGVYWL